MGTQTFPTSLGINLKGKISFVRSFNRIVRVPFYPRSSFVRSYHNYRSRRIVQNVFLVGSARAPQRLGAGQLGWAVTLGPTDSDMSDLQHEDVPRKGSPEREDEGEDGVESVYVSPARPAGGPGARHGAWQRGGQHPEVEEGGGAKGDWRSLACPEPTAHKSRRSVRPRGLVEAARRYVGAASAARAWSPGAQGAGRSVRGNGHSSTASRGGQRSEGHCRHDCRGRARPGWRARSRIRWRHACHRRSCKDQWHCKQQLTRTRRHRSYSWPALEAWQCDRRIPGPVHRASGEARFDGGRATRAC